MSEPRFAVGDQVRCWKPGYAEHGSSGVVDEVRDYDGPAFQGAFAYRCNWRWSDGAAGWRGSLPDVMVVSERYWLDRAKRG